MSKSQSKPKAASEASIGARLVVILFALGIVVIGAYPIRKDVRDMVGSAKSYFNKNLPILSGNSRPADRAGDPSARARYGEDTSLLLDSEDLPAPVKPKGITVDKEAHQKPQLDKLTHDDRKQLSELVNGF